MEDWKKELRDLMLSRYRGGISMPKETIDEIEVFVQKLLDAQMGVLISNRESAITEMRKLGYSMDRIAKRLGIGKTTVFFYIHKNDKFNSRLESEKQKAVELARPEIVSKAKLEILKQLVSQSRYNEELALRYVDTDDIRDLIWDIEKQSLISEINKENE